MGMAGMLRYWPLIRSALLRRPTEAFLILLAVTFGFALYGFMVALNATSRQVIDAARSDRIYVNSRFGSPKGLPLALQQQIETIDGVTGVGAARWVFGYHQAPGKPFGVFTVDEGMRVGWSELSLQPAEWDLLFSSGTGVLVTRKAAQRWDLHKGDLVPIPVQPGTRADGARSWVFQVLAIVADDPEWEEGVIIGNYAHSENARPVDSRGYVQVFRVAVRDPARANAIAMQIDQRFANSGTPTISVTNKANREGLVRSGVAISSMTWGVGTAGLFMVIFLAGNSIAQSVRRRLPEFATLKAMGYTDVQVAWLVFVESAIPCGLGAMLGIGLAATLAAVPRRHIPSALASVPHATVTLATLEWALASALLIAFVGSVLPIVSLWHLNVATAITGRSR
jgi:putative ABC transport system permease protein